jgi:hypothetical protein
LNWGINTESFFNSFTTLGEIAWAVLLILGFAIAFRLQSEGKISKNTFGIVVTAIQAAFTILATVFGWKGYESGLRFVEHTFEWAMRTIGSTHTQLFIAAAITGIGVRISSKSRKGSGMEGSK